MASLECASNSSRLKETEREVLNRQKRKRNSGEVMKLCNKKRKSSENCSIGGSIKFYVQSQSDKTALFNKLDQAKLCVEENISSVSNYSILNKALDLFISTVGIQETRQTTCDGEPHKEEHYKPYLYSAEHETDDRMFVCTDTAMINIVNGLQEHALSCQHPMRVSDKQMFGHVSKMSLKCCEGHNLRLDSSSHIEGGKFLVNMRMIHGVNTSGLRYVQYERFCKASGLGVCSETMFSDVHGVYCEATEMCAQQSIQEAIHMEQSGNLDSHGIGILTDARHGTRKNSAFSDGIALGCKTHKVVAVKTVTKKDDSVSQRHELFGVKEIYKDFERKDVKFDIHGHDRNSSVNKYLANEHPDIRNANDTWHATKGIAKIMKSIGTGPKKNHGKTWHEQLTDKAASVKTASYYAMKNCNGSSIKLRQFLDNIPEHYQGNHQNCASESRCKVEGVIYESSKCTLTNTVAIDLLSNSIRKLQIYRTPEDYVACIDTHYVESYNNATLIYHDKRITFGETEYKRRTHLSIADWNENVDRDTTSIVLFEDVRNPRQRSGHRNLKPKTFLFTQKIWNFVIHKCY